MDWMLAGWCFLYGGLALMAVAVVLEVVGLGRLVRECLGELRTKSAAVRDRIETFRRNL